MNEGNNNQSNLVKLNPIKLLDENNVSKSIALFNPSIITRTKRLSSFVSIFITFVLCLIVVLALIPVYLAKNDQSLNNSPQTLSYSTSQLPNFQTDPQTRHRTSIPDVNQIVTPRFDPPENIQTPPVNIPQPVLVPVTQVPITQLPIPSIPQNIPTVVTAPVITTATTEDPLEFFIKSLMTTTTPPKLQAGLDMNLERDLNPLKEEPLQPLPPKQFHPRPPMNLRRNKLKNRNNKALINDKNKQF